MYIKRSECYFALPRNVGMFFNGAQCLFGLFVYQKCLLRNLNNLLMLAIKRCTKHGQKVFLSHKISF